MDHRVRAIGIVVECHTFEVFQHTMLSVIRLSLCTYSMYVFTYLYILSFISIKSSWQKFCYLLHKSI